MSSSSESQGFVGAESDGLQGRSRMRKGGKSKGKKDTLPYLAQLNSSYQKIDFIENLGKAFEDKLDFEQDTSSGSKAVLHSQPFSCCLLPKFVRDELFLEGLRDELLDQIFIEKNNDLYKFQQTDDLRKISTPHVRAVRKLLYDVFLDWMRETTGIKLTDKVDLTCSKYDHTDVLLCHDDELDTRRIAFILYLVPPWKSGDGGSLDLFNMDEHGQPKDIMRSILPAWNTLAWFEVTEVSHHQVAEVLTEDKTRLSINGWFHGPVAPRCARYVEPSKPLTTYTSIEEAIFNDWINPIYLEQEVQYQIQERFEVDSEIELQGFLKEEKYLALISALKDENVKWTMTGPANKRHYLKAEDDDESLPQIIRDCMTFLQSEAMFLTLSNLTGLTLHPLAAQRDSDTDNDHDDSSCETLPAGGATGEDGSKSGTGSESEVSSTEKAKPRKKRRKLNSECSDKKQAGEQSEEASEVPGNPTCRCEVRKWTNGCYTLVHDTDAEGSEFALDSMLYCFCKGWQQEYGGYTSYIAKDEDDELLSVNPAENSLGLVYRDKESLRFVKYINSQIRQMQNGGQFFDIATVYYE